MTTHAEQRLVRHSPEQLFDLVADVRRYPEFLPWCLAARTRKQTDTELVADLIIGFQVFKEQFTSHVQMDSDALIIKVEYTEGPFKYLTNSWKFLKHPEGCTIDFYVDFEFKSRLLQTVIESLFTEAVKRMVSAFETRADTLYTLQIKKDRPSAS
jgi:coenzyme Q-binding protein COQ10